MGTKLLLIEYPLKISNILVFIQVHVYLLLFFSFFKSKHTPFKDIYIFLYIVLYRKWQKKKYQNFFFHFATTHVPLPKLTQYQRITLWEYWSLVTEPTNDAKSANDGQQGPLSTEEFQSKSSWRPIFQWHYSKWSLKPKTLWKALHSCPSTQFLINRGPDPAKPLQG